MELTEEQKKLVGEADLLMLNAEDHTYAKVALTDEDGLQAAIEGVSPSNPHSPRGLIWGSLWENVRDARLPVTTYVDAVVRNVSRNRAHPCWAPWSTTHRSLSQPSPHPPAASASTTLSTTHSQPHWHRLSPAPTSS